VEHALVVHGLQHPEEVDADLQGGGDRQRAGGQAPVEGLPVEAALGEVEDVALVAAGDEQAAGADVDALEDVGLVLEPQAHRGGQVRGSDRLHDHRRAVGRVDPFVGGDAVGVLEQARQREASHARTGCRARFLGTHLDLVDVRAPSIRGSGVSGHSPCGPFAGPSAVLRAVRAHAVPRFRPVRAVRVSRRRGGRSGSGAAPA
jgi:hypothetical protein